jgi:hypothetical protein
MQIVLREQLTYCCEKDGLRSLDRCHYLRTRSIPQDIGRGVQQRMDPLPWHRSMSGIADQTLQTVVSPAAGKLIVRSDGPPRPTAVLASVPSRTKQKWSICRDMYWSFQHSLESKEQVREAAVLGGRLMQEYC